MTGGGPDPGGRPAGQDGPPVSGETDVPAEPLLSSPPPVAVPLSALSCASLVLALLGFLVLTWFAAIVTGILALVRLPRSGERGRGLAVLALLLCGGWALALTGALAAGHAGPYTGLADAVGLPHREEHPRALQQGDCLSGVVVGAITATSVVPCEERHDAEVIGTVDLPDSPYDAATLQEVGIARCRGPLAAFLERLREGVDPTSLRMAVILPRPEDWQQGSRQVLCVAAGDEGAALPWPLLREGLSVQG